MSLRLRLSRRLYVFLGVLILLASALVPVVLYVGSSTSTETAPPRSTGSLLGTMAYHGPTSLETRIVSSDIIARVKLVSATQVVERLSDYPSEGETSYAKALEFKFEALEYLKGSGGNELVAVAYDREGRHETEEAAAASAEDFLSVRDTRWDDRDAIVFLWDDHLYVPSTKKEDRYSLGALRYFAFGEDNYTIASRHNRMWLPAASASTLAGVIAAVAPGGGEQHFLLEVPSNEGAVFGFSESQPSETQTITLSELKARIAEVEKEIKAGDGSEEYWECVLHKYVWEGEVRYRKELLASQGEGYYHMRYDHTLASGQAAGSVIYIFELRHDYIAVHGETIPSKYEAMFQLGGRDKDLFDVEYPGEVSLARPLPTGEYKFYFNHTPKRFIVCDGKPEEERKRREHFVTVTAPDGTLHEAFFDPIAEGAALVADDFRGTLKPTDFSSGGSTTTIRRIGWDSNRTWMELSSATSLTGHHIDFIELDGSVGLTLDFDDATATSTDDGAHALVWGVCGQPWSAGDKLMLRISLSEETLTGTTNDSSCDGDSIDTSTPPAIKPMPCTNGVAVPNPSDNMELVRDCQVLLEVLDALRGEGGDVLKWSEQMYVDDWSGVVVSGTPARVTRLNFAYKGLRGTVSSEIGELYALVRVDMRGNLLTGSIPSEMGSLTDLEYLNLKGNGLTGAIPSELGKLTNLGRLYLDDNDLSGAIPSELGKLTGLERLYLRNNDLTGAIPSELGDLTQLVYVYILAGNELTGCVPASWEDIDKSDDPTAHGLSYCGSE